MQWKLINFSIHPRIERWRFIFAVAFFNYVNAQSFFIPWERSVFQPIERIIDSIAYSPFIRRSVFAELDKKSRFRGQLGIALSWERYEALLFRLTRDKGELSGNNIGPSKRKRGGREIEIECNKDRWSWSRHSCWKKRARWVDRE